MTKQKRVSNGIKTVSSASGAGKTGHAATCRRMNLDHFLTPYIKINSNWRKDLSGRQEAIKILEEKAGKNLFDLARSNFLLNMSQRQGKQKQK